MSGQTLLVPCYCTGECSWHRCPRWVPWWLLDRLHSEGIWKRQSGQLLSKETEDEASESCMISKGLGWEFSGYFLSQQFLKFVDLLLSSQHGLFCSIRLFKLWTYFILHFISCNSHSQHRNLKELWGILQRDKILFVTGSRAVCEAGRYLRGSNLTNYCEMLIFWEPGVKPSPQPIYPPGSVHCEIGFLKFSLMNSGYHCVLVEPWGDSIYTP